MKKELFAVLAMMAMLFAFSMTAPAFADGPSWSYPETVTGPQVMSNISTTTTGDSSPWHFKAVSCHVTTGPTFVNTTGLAVDVQASYDSGQTWTTLKSYSGINVDAVYDYPANTAPTNVRERVRQKKHVGVKQKATVRRSWR